MVRKSDSDQVTVIGCCVTLVEAVRAAEQLASSGINIRIIDPFTIKPLDAATILTNARETGGRIITVEDHYEWGESEIMRHFQGANVKDALLLVSVEVSTFT